MPQFIFTCHGGKKPETQEDGQKGMEAWEEWAAGLGSALVNPGTSVGVTKVMTKDGVSDDPSPHPVMGFSIIEAENMTTALDMLKDCPHMQMFEGTLEVSEMMRMPV